MHELGVTFKVIENLEAVAKENHLEHISRCTLRLGEVSTVIPKLLLVLGLGYQEASGCCRLRTGS